MPESKKSTEHKKDWEDTGNQVTSNEEKGQTSSLRRELKMSEFGEKY